MIEKLLKIKIINNKQNLNIRNILNKLKWDPKENIEHYELSFVHRGVPRDVKIIPCDIITGVEASWFIYKNQVNGETLIPFHRVIEIKNIMTGQIVWKKRT